MNRCHATLIAAIAAVTASGCTNSHPAIDDVERASLLGRAFICNEETNAQRWIEVWAETDRGCVFLDFSSREQHETVTCSTGEPFMTVATSRQLVSSKGQTPARESNVLMELGSMQLVA